MRFLLVCMTMSLLLFPQTALAQGKNKVVRENFDWKIYQTDHFKIFFYTAEEHLLESVANMVEAAYRDVSDKLQHQLNFPVPFIMYKTHEEFEQTHIFPGFLPRAVQGFSEPFQSRILLSLDRPEEDLFALITHELVHIFQYDMLFNNRIGTILRANAPKWFMEGMASYVADDEDNLDRMFLRDVAVNTNFGSLRNYSGQSYAAYRVGHAVFAFIEQEYGIEGVRDFLWQYRKNITGSVSGALQRAFDIDVEEFERDFRKYLRKRYISLLPVKEEPDDFAREIRTRKVISTLSPELSPSGDLMAAIVPIKNDLDLVLISTQDGRIFKNLTKGHTNDYSQINVGAFNGINDLGWNPDGKEIVFAARKEGTMVFFVVNVLNGKIIDKIRFTGIRDANAPVFSNDGKKIYFAANAAGFYNIFSYDRATKAIENLTKDEAYDRNPRVSPDGKEILYSSMQDGFFKIFALNLETGEKTQLTSGLGNDIQANYSQDMKSIYFSSDRFDDIYNIFELELETGVKKQYTNILTGAFSPQERVVFNHKEGEERRQLVFTAFYQGRYRVYRMDRPEDREEYYDVAKDNYKNIKDYDMDAGVQLDPELFKKYTLKNNFTIAGADVSAGLIDDGRVVSNTRVQFTDTLGNHNLDLLTYTVSSYESYYLNYTNKTKRLQWGSAFQAEQSFFIGFQQFGTDISLERLERSYKDLSLTGYFRYPFSTFSRVDFGGGVVDRDYITLDEIDIPVVLPDGTLDPVNTRSVFVGVEADYTEPMAYVSFSRDTVKYQSYGPQHGMMFNLNYTYIANAADSFNLNLRSYKELSRRSLYAMRLIGNYSDGDVPTLYTLGGRNNLRGDYEYQQFIGSRRVLWQNELRFPLIDILRFPGLTFGNIRGLFFVDVGGAWINDDNFDFEFQSDDDGYDGDIIDRRYLQGTIGLGASMRLFGLDVNWTWSKRTNFETVPSDSRLSFWIGRNF